MERPLIVPTSEFSSATGRVWALRTGAAVTLLAAGLLALASCNTVEGAGKDIEQAGDAVQNAAD